MQTEQMGYKPIESGCPKKEFTLFDTKGFIAELNSIMFFLNMRKSPGWGELANSPRKKKMVIYN